MPEQSLRVPASGSTGLRRGSDIFVCLQAPWFPRDGQGADSQPAGCRTARLVPGHRARAVVSVWETQRPDVPQVHQVVIDAPIELDTKNYFRPL